MTVRHDQVASIIQRAVQVLLTRGLNDPRVRGLVSVTRVSVTPDLAQATVFVSVIPDERAELTMHGLRHAAKHIRSAIAPAVNLRSIPRLSFKHDASIRRQTEVFAAIARGRTPDADDATDPAEPTTPEELSP